MAVSLPVNTKKAVVRVGSGGRGFVVGTDHSRFVITAAHCVPPDRLPTPHPGNGSSELTFQDVIGPLGKRAKQKIWGELCAFSLTDDIAMFSEPDNQEISDQYDAYLEFMDGRPALKIGAPSAAQSPDGWVLSLDGIWKPCTVHTANNGRFLSTRGAKIEGGMSGSPILNAHGDAIGLISTAEVHPILSGCLPPWLQRLIADAAA
jgi:trypsin-like peptidase